MPRDSAGRTESAGHGYQQLRRDLILGEAPELRVPTMTTAKRDNRRRPQTRLSEA